MIIHICCGWIVEDFPSKRRPEIVWWYSLCGHMLKETYIYILCRHCLSSVNIFLKIIAFKCTQARDLPGEWLWVLCCCSKMNRAVLSSGHSYSSLHMICLTSTLKWAEYCTYDEHICIDSSLSANQKLRLAETNKF